LLSQIWGVLAMAMGENNFSIEQTRGSVSIASKWAHAASSGKDLNSVLTDFRKLVSAETVQVVRRMSHFDRTRMIARQTESDGKLFSRPARSFASAMLGDMLHKTHCGNVFFMTALLSDSDTKDYLEPLGLRDVGIVSLSNEDDCTDFLEFHFNFRLVDHDRQLLQVLGPVLSKSWSDRTAGVAAAHLAKNPFPTARACEKAFENILSTRNPAGLTRSEFRICMLVQEGGLPDKVTDVLQISKSTFRSHLRSIYFKTGVAGHVELVHLLHQSVGKEPDISARKSFQR
jgi:DNA-binding CsgD family transcriptional regulator